MSVNQTNVVRLVFNPGLILGDICKSLMKIANSDSMEIRLSRNKISLEIIF